MKVLVAPHNFEIGGSQINALELASAVAKTPGFEVILYAPKGELTDRARATGLELYTTSLRENALSFLRIRELSKLVAAYDIDLVHAYEWAPTIDAAIGVAWTRGVPVLSTILSMEYPYFLPKDLPTTFGTREMWEAAKHEGRKAFLLEPPVDINVYYPHAISDADVAMIRSECRAGDGDILVVSVGRLAAALKLEGLLTLIQAVGILSREFPLKLAIVGDGPVRNQVQQAADVVNRQSHRDVVHILGSRENPLPYYSAADVVVGMGSSALKAMALGKPLLIQGEKGFWRIADEDSIELFRVQGWYGVGESEYGVSRCATELRALITSSKARLQQLGRFGHALVQRDYSLPAVAEHLVRIYSDVSSSRGVSKQRAVVKVLSLNRDIAKYHLSIKMPWLRTVSRRYRGKL